MWIWLIVLVGLSVWFAKWAYPLDGLVEHTPAYEKNLAPQKDLGELFSKMGMEPGATARLNPCVEIEANASRYCTVHAI